MTVAAMVGNGAGEYVAKTLMKFEMHQHLGEVGSRWDDNGKLEAGGTTMLNCGPIVSLYFSSFSNHPFPIPLYTAVHD